MYNTKNEIIVVLLTNYIGEENTMDLRRKERILSLVMILMGSLALIGESIFLLTQIISSVIMVIALTALTTAGIMVLVLGIRLLSLK